MVYLGKHFYQELGDVHYRIVEVLDNDEIRNALVISYRGSGKSTFSSLAYPLYCALEKKRNFIVLIGDTYNQAEIIIQNMKYELENNFLIRADYGDVRTDIWATSRLVLKNMVRVIARSKGQKLRGLKHMQYRPDLIIVDDPQARDDVRTDERRLEDYRWFTTEVMGAVDKENGRIFVIGNLLHKDALLPRLSAMGLFHELKIPIVENGKSTWLARYPTLESVEAEAKKNDPIFWAREFELKIVPEEGQIITEEDIQYYDDPEPSVMQYTGVGVDLAISQKESADYTSMVGARVYRKGDALEIRIYDRVVNDHIDFHQTQDTAKTFAVEVGRDYAAHLFVEDVAYQKAAIQELERKMLPVTGIKTGGRDKRARLMTVAPLIKNGTVKFPRQGAEKLITQLLGFGIESHDDMVDALVTLLIGLSSWGIQEIEWIN